MELASNIPTHGQPALVPHFMVRARYTWGRAPTIEAAIRNANLAPGEACHVCRTDDNAQCDEIAGNLSFNARTPIWEGKVTRNGRDVRLVSITHPGYRVGDATSAEDWPA